MCSFCFLNTIAIVPPVRSGNCVLQDLPNNLNIIDIPYEKKVPPTRWNRDFPLQRDASKCVKCMRCIQICDKVQTLNVWDVAATGSRTTVDVSYNRKITDADCSLCGQCITHCPAGALRARDDTAKAFAALGGSGYQVTVVQSGARRPGGLGRGAGAWTPARPRSAGWWPPCGSMGADYVYRHNDSAADLTIMEEGSELLHRLRVPRRPFQACRCSPPAARAGCGSSSPNTRIWWPDACPRPNRPQQMFGAVSKTWAVPTCLGVAAGKDLLRFHHALRGEKSGVRAARHAVRPPARARMWTWC